MTAMALCVAKSEGCSGLECEACQRVFMAEVLHPALHAIGILRYPLTIQIRHKEDAIALLTTFRDVFYASWIKVLDARRGAAQALATASAAPATEHRAAVPATPAAGAASSPPTDAWASKPASPVQVPAVAPAVTEQLPGPAVVAGDDKKPKAGRSKGGKGKGAPAITRRPPARPRPPVQLNGAPPPAVTPTRPRSEPGPTSGSPPV